MPRNHGGHHQHALPRRRRFLPLAAAAAVLLLLALLILLPDAPHGEPAALASLLRAAIAAHPSPVSYVHPCADHLSLSLHRLRAALSSLESGDLPAALHLASASLQYQPQTLFRLRRRGLPDEDPPGCHRLQAKSSSEVVRLLDCASCRQRGTKLHCWALRHHRGRRYIQGKRHNSVRKDQHFDGGRKHGATVITASRSVGIEGLSTYDTVTVAVIGDGFGARDITFENSAGAGAHQAVAFRSDIDRSVLENVEFRGHQDTLYARTMRHLYCRCRIIGTVDFIFGNAAAMFEDCVIKAMPRAEGARKSAHNVVVANGRIDPGQTTGFVFQNCTVNGNKEFMVLFQAKPQSYRLYLGWPWKEHARTIYVSCYLGKVIRPEGWLPWRGDFALRTLYYGVFDSRGPGANHTARIEWSNQTTEQHVKFYSIENLIQGHEWIAY